jgi:hypothetical protein
MARNQMDRRTSNGAESLLANQKSATPRAQQLKLNGPVMNTFAGPVRGFIKQRIAPEATQQTTVVNTHMEFAYPAVGRYESDVAGRRVLKVPVAF